MSEKIEEKNNENKINERINWEKHEEILEIYKKIKDMGYKLCLVSPELQSQSEKLEEYTKYLKEEEIKFDAICTKEYNIEKWKKNF